MSPLFVVEFEKQREVLNEKDFHKFLNLCVIHNKDITSFTVTDLSRQPIPVSIVSEVAGIALLKYNRNLNGGSLTTNFDKMYLYD